MPENIDLIDARPVPRPGTWAAAVIVALLSACLAYSLVTNPNYRWDVVGQYLFDSRVLQGVGWTLTLTAASMVLGVALAVTTAVMRMSTNPVLRGVAYAYIWFFRGTPIYTQLIFWGIIAILYPTISFGIPFGPELFSFDTQAVMDGFIAKGFLPALLGLGLNEGAYLSEIVRSGLNSIDRGQWEASTALGMKRSTTLRRIIIPQAMRVIVPPTGNETISMLKTTSLVTAVPFTLDLTFATQAIGNQSFLPVPLLITAAIWYLLITSLLMVGQSRIETYYGKGFDPDRPRRLSSRQRSVLAARTTGDDLFLDVTP
ncbi:amino acid ABC transporter permease [uncultured Tessaracoccus sp.]|uniref:amino acid ABC transporter permease n=1 Tax=uncultured Tessaracoccus sp. TaxID=905023 RepID=UPI002606B14B|nr:amino acid ABC transporter permease [uncultured Tessaracoccus sp.]